MRETCPLCHTYVPTGEAYMMHLGRKNEHGEWKGSSDAIMTFLHIACVEGVDAQTSITQQTLQGHG